MISAEIVADSINPQGDRLTSLLITFPRFILAEINTHRMLSKNTSSSRAIPFNKMVEAIQNNPFIPIAWQKHHSGMQGTEYLDIYKSQVAKEHWLKARDNAVLEATLMNRYQVTKQLCNRLLEPFMWTTMLITGSKEGWDNFFELRCPQYKGSFSENVYKSRKEAIKSPYNEFDNFGEMDWLWSNKGQAEIHLMDLAEKIYDAMNESTPKQLQAGEWHIPFEDTFDLNNLEMQLYRDGLSPEEVNSILQDSLLPIKISTAMAARTSYTVVGDEKRIDTKKMINLHDRLIEMRHDSPLEHCARAMTDEEYETFIKGELVELNPERDFNENIEIEEPLHKEKGWCRNFKGFLSYRSILEGEK